VVENAEGTYLNLKNILTDDLNKEMMGKMVKKAGMIYQMKLDNCFAKQYYRIYSLKI
jgi:hypothetical protein